MTVHTQIDRDGIVRHFIQELESWDDFTAIVNRVRQSFDSTIVRQGDGPDSRFCILSVEGREVTFIHDDMLGNCFFSRDKEAEEVIRAISVIFSARLY